MLICFIFFEFIGSTTVGRVSVDPRAEVGVNYGFGKQHASRRKYQEKQIFAKKSRNICIIHFFFVHLQFDYNYG